MSKSKSSSLVAAALLASSGPAASQDAGDSMQKARLAEACGIELSLSVAGCRCLTDRAMVDLNDLQRDYLLATAIAPSAADRMRDRVSQDDVRVLAKFLVTAEQECSAE